MNQYFLYTHVQSADWNGSIRMHGMREAADCQRLPGDVSGLWWGARQHEGTESGTVRPSTDLETAEVFECVACGSRVRDPETRTCGGCGGELLNIGAERDL